MTIIFFLYGVLNKDMDVTGLVISTISGIAVDAFILALLALASSLK